MLQIQKNEYQVCGCRVEAMCNMMAVALSVDVRQAPGGNEADAANQIWSMICEAGLGALFAPGWLEQPPPPTFKSALKQAQWEQSMRYEKLIAQRLYSLVGHGAPKNVVMFLLMSGPGAGCICNATRNNFSPPEPHPERASIVSFLRGLLSLRFVQSAAIFYGPPDIAEPRLSKLEVETETPERFVEHFFTEIPGMIIGNGASGFFFIPVA